MLQDIRLALRRLRKQPAFAVLAILIVALGAGANAAVFAVVNAVLLRPLPYDDPSRLAVLGPTTFVSPQDVAYLRARARCFSEIASSSPGWMMSMLGAGDPVQIVAARPSGNLFDMLGVQPVIGRLLHPDDGVAGRPRVMVLAYALWQSRFGGDRAVVGRYVVLDGVRHEIVGVMPREAGAIDREAEAWVPFDPASAFSRARNSLAYGRLNLDVEIAAASRELQALIPEMRRANGGTVDPTEVVAVVPLATAISGEVRRPLLFVMAAVGLLLLLTAANLGTLVLGRQIGRRRDAAVRRALGASSFRLARESLVENALVALAGATGGLVAARLALPALVRLLPPEIPRLDETAVDPVVIAAVLGTSVLAVLFFGVLPSLLASAVTIQPLLRQGVQTDPRSNRRLLDVLVVAQVALAIVLGVSAGLMGRSLWALQHVDPGFAAEHVLVLRLQPAGERYRAPGRTLAYYRRVSEEIGALPGVQRVGLINHLPLSGYNWVMRVQPADRPAVPGATTPSIGWRMIDGDYFDALRIPIRAGRAFGAADDGNSPRVVIVNETAARKFFGSADAAIGRGLRMSGPTGDQIATIVGVAGDVRHASIAESPEPELYRPMAQAFAMAMTLVVRTAGAPADAAAMVRSAVRSVDADIAIAGMAPLASALRENLGRPRMVAMLLLVFAAVGVTVVVCGVYGVVAYSVRRRERELGIRLALGAARSSIGSLVLRQGIAYASLGVLVGLPAAVAVARLMRHLLFGVEPQDPLVLVGLSSAVVLATLVATVVPARRAGRIQPASLLRGD